MVNNKLPLRSLLVQSRGRLWAAETMSASSPQSDKFNFLYKIRGSALAFQPCKYQIYIKIPCYFGAPMMSMILDLSCPTSRLETIPPWNAINFQLQYPLSLDMSIFHFLSSFIRRGKNRPRVTVTSKLVPVLCLNYWLTSRRIQWGWWQEAWSLVTYLIHAKTLGSYFCFIDYQTQIPNCF